MIDSSKQEASNCTSCGMQSADCTCLTVLVRDKPRSDNLVSPLFTADTNNGAYLPDTVFDHRYKIIRRVGGGGMGSVFEAEHLVLSKRVALKVLRSEFLSDPEAMSRFHQEARACAGLSHANLVDVFDCGVTPQEEPFLVMDYLNGRSLLDFLKQRGALPLNELLDIFLPIIDGLAYAHSQGVVHRDLKPSNIVLTEAHDAQTVPVIVDFGVAKVEELGGQMQMLTQTGQLLGSPAYMSPEQCKGQAIDQRTDIYSLGCLLYESATGKQAFVGHTMMATLEKQITEMPKSPQDIASVPPRLSGMIMRCLEKQPEARFQSCSDLKLELERLRKPKLQGYVRNRNNETWLYFALAASFILFAALIFYVLSNQLSAHRSPATVPSTKLTSLRSRLGDTMELAALDTYRIDGEIRDEGRLDLENRFKMHRGSLKERLSLALPLLLDYSKEERQLLRRNSGENDQRLRLRSDRKQNAVRMKGRECFAQIKSDIEAHLHRRKFHLKPTEASIIGLTMSHGGRFESRGEREKYRAELTFRNALKVCETSGSPPWVLAKINHHFGELLEKMKRVQEADKVFQESEKEFKSSESMRNNWEHRHMLMHLARTSMKLKKLDDSLSYINLAIDMAAARRSSSEVKEFTSYRKRILDLMEKNGKEDSAKNGTKKP